MIKKYDMHDCMISMDADDLIHGLFQEVLDKKNELYRSSKFHIGEKVCMTKDYHSIAVCLKLAYDYTSAYRIARDLRGRVVTVSDIDELIDAKGIGVYYTIEDEHGMMYSFPEHILNKI